MAFVAAFTFALLSLPQGQDPQPILSAPEMKALHDKLAKYMEAKLDVEINKGDEKKHEKASKAEATAKGAFMKEWDSRVDKKPELAKSMPDLLALYDNVFPYERKSGSGQIKKEEAKGVVPEYSLFVPKAYKETTPTRTVLVIPGNGDRGWTEGREWWKQIWDGAACNADTIFHVAQVNKNADLDPFPDYSKDGADEKEQARIKEAMGSFGETWRSYNIDRRHLFLDAAKDSCAFALRLASYFPDRFTGIILRDVPPANDIKDLRFGSLTGLPVLMVATAANKAAFEAIKKSLDEQKDGSATILEATDAYPFPGARAEIEKWMAAQKRDFHRTRVVLEPNHNRLAKNGYWVEIGQMDDIWGLPLAQRPRLEVEADRKTNRITVKTRGIESFALHLNDYLVDLDKEFTIIVNDKAFPEKRTRDFQKMRDWMITKVDGDRVFPVYWECRVPKSEKADKVDKDEKK